MGHLMGAIDLEGFRPLADFQADMASTFDLIRESSKAPGHDRIYIHGEPEAMAEASNRRDGIGVSPAMKSQLETWGQRLGVEAGLG
jgi:LDH2 family malate/lactate/ureidoglycolate dehydrogenase